MIHLTRSLITPIKFSIREDLILMVTHYELPEHANDTLKAIHKHTKSFITVKIDSIDRGYNRDSGSLVLNTTTIYVTESYEEIIGN